MQKLVSQKLVIQKLATLLGLAVALTVGDAPQSVRSGKAFAAVTQLAPVVCRPPPDGCPN
jgi:hypothetical protein